MLAVVALIARIVLAIVFATAAISKVTDRQGFRSAARQLGVPNAMAPAVSFLVPTAELCLAIVFVSPLYKAAAVGALALLLAFTSLLLVNLALGRRPSCRCFGRRVSQIGWLSVVRNLWLFATAGLVVWEGQSASLPGMISSISGATLRELLGFFVASWLATTALMGWLLFNLVLQQGRLLNRIAILENRSAAVLRGHEAMAVGEAETHDGLHLGSFAPEFELPDVDGNLITSSTLESNGVPLLLLFSDAACGSCRALLPDIAIWQAKHASALQIAIACSGSARSIRKDVATYGLRNVMIDDKRSVSDSFRCRATPSAVIIGTRRRILSPLVMGAGDIQALVGSFTSRDHGPSSNDHRERRASTQVAIAKADDEHFMADLVRQADGSLLPGDLAPKFALLDQQNTMFTSADLLGHLSLLVFWNPDCGFCQRLLPELAEWEPLSDRDSVRLVILTSQGMEPGPESALKTAVLKDPNGDVMRLYRVNGTPVGVVVDGNGLVASPPIVGGTDILGALRGVNRARRERLR